MSAIVAEILLLLVIPIICKRAVDKELRKRNEEKKTPSHA